MGLTGFDSLLGKYRDEFDHALWHLVRYESGSTLWRERLESLILHIVEVRRVGRTGGFVYDLGIITAHHETELEAILRLPCSWREYSVVGESFRYHVGSLRVGGKRFSVCASAAGDMGVPASASLAMSMVSAFRPRYLALAGIAAGVGGNLGDVVIADQVIDYGSGKVWQGAEGATQFAPSTKPIGVDAALEQALRHFALNARALGDIQLEWPGPRSSSRLAARVGPFATSVNVVEDEAVVRAVKASQRDVVAIEMEGYGVLYAASHVSEPRPKAMVIKGTSDFAGPERSEEARAYAAYTSAAFLLAFAKTALFGGGQSGRAEQDSAVARSVLE